MNNDFDGVLAQFRAYGVPDPKLPLDTSGKKVIYGPGKKAWYRINEYQAKNGKTYLHGYFGFKDQHYKIEFDAPSMSQEDQARLRAQREAADRAEAERRAREAAVAAERATNQYRRATDRGVEAHDYVVVKQIRPEMAKLVTDTQQHGWLIIPLTRFGKSELVGSQKIAPKSEGGEKRFNQGMAKHGACVLLGDITADTPFVGLTEGYATAGSVRAGLDYQYPVVAGIDAGNLHKVVADIRGVYPDLPILIFADDDYLTGNKGLAEAAKAAKLAGRAHIVLPRFTVARAANKAEAKAALPKALTDFNDLHVEEGLDALRGQCQAAVSALLGSLNPSEVQESVEPAQADSELVTADEGAGEGGDLLTLTRDYAIVHGKNKAFDTRSNNVMTMSALRSLFGKKVVADWLDLPVSKKRVVTESEVNSLLGQKADNSSGLSRVLGRYVYLDGSDSVFDVELFDIIPQAAMKLATGELFKLWCNSESRKVIPFRNVVFDPTQRTTPDNHINMFRGLSAKPAAGTEHMQNILDGLAHLCNEDTEVFYWLTKWMAYPLQHIGTKMATAVIMHSSVHGSGKSLIWEECYKPIFGEYGVTVGQHQLESQYTGWRSRKLFGLCEELLSNNQRFSHTGALKQLVTGKTQQIERKFRDAMEEANHINLVFLSNEIQPFNVEAHDRRYLVIWPEKTLPVSIQKGIESDIANGGIAQFYQWLLDLDTSDFGPHTKPPMTAAKRRLIDVGLPSWHRFWNEWQDGMDGELQVPYIPCFSNELFSLYEQWCARVNEKSPLSQHRFSSYLSAELGAGSKQRLWASLPSGARKQGTAIIPTPLKGTDTQEVLFGASVVRFRDAAMSAGWKTESWV